MQRMFGLGRRTSTTTATAGRDEHQPDADNNQSSETDDDSEIVLNVRQYRPEGNSDPHDNRERELTNDVNTALHVPSSDRNGTPYPHNVRRSTPKQLSNIAEASHELPSVEAMSPIEAAAALPSTEQRAPVAVKADNASPELARQSRVTFGGVYERERPVTPPWQGEHDSVGAGYQPPLQLYDQYGTPVRLTSSGIDFLSRDSYGSTMSTPSRSSGNSSDGRFNVSPGYEADRSTSRTPERRPREQPFSNKDKSWQVAAGHEKSRIYRSSGTSTVKIGKRTNYTFCHVNVLTDGATTKLLTF